MALPIHTARLTVREVTMTDLDELAVIYAHPEVLWWEPAPFTRDQTLKWLVTTIGRYRDEGMAEYAVALAATEELVGVCGPVCREIEGERLPELGWDLARESWGHGYATEAARAVLPHAAGLGLRRVYSLIDPANIRSQGVARRLGMTVERRVVWADRPHDLWALDLA
jgi:ribosomal-protein-alanine N-acetyltransferase